MHDNYLKYNGKSMLEISPISSKKKFQLSWNHWMTKKKIPRISHNRSPTAFQNHQISIHTIMFSSFPPTKIPSINTEKRREAFVGKHLHEIFLPIGHSTHPNISKVPLNRPKKNLLFSFGNFECITDGDSMKAKEEIQ